MTPRLIAAKELNEAFCTTEFKPIVYADRIFNAITAAGYSIIHDSDNHGPTVERAAGIAKNTFVGDTLSPTWRVASTIRAMTTGGRNAE